MGKLFISRQQVCVADCLPFVGYSYWRADSCFTVFEAFSWGVDYFVIHFEFEGACRGIGEFYKGKSCWWGCAVAWFDKVHPRDQITQWWPYRQYCQVRWTHPKNVFLAPIDEWKAERIKRRLFPDLIIEQTPELKNQ